MYNNLDFFEYMTCFAPNTMKREPIAKRLFRGVEVANVKNKFTIKSLTVRRIEFVIYFWVS